VVRRDDAHNPRPHLINGLMRVKIEASRAEAEFRRAPADGRLIISASGRGAGSSSHRPPPAVSYRLLASSAEEQFAELLTVFGLQRAVESGESRCGICNAVAWITLQPKDLHGRVPKDVLKAEREFYQCGSCRQIFWPGTKYASPPLSPPFPIHTHSLRFPCAPPSPMNRPLSPRQVHEHHPGALGSSMPPFHPAPTTPHPRPDTHIPALSIVSPSCTQIH
jgi:uncharacterized protein with PIN domain